MNAVICATLATTAVTFVALWSCAEAGTVPTQKTSTSSPTDSPTTARTKAPTTPGPPTVNLQDLGNLRGVRRQLPDGLVEAFLGIPYGKPPVGDLRFQPPVAYDVTSRNFDATKLPPACFQRAQNMTMSEDCLYLNVWKPSAALAAQRAVMVWIYGGGFSGGSASSPFYDGTVLSLKGDVVVVSMQYRLGALGFLALDDDYLRGNYGLLDQQLALRWVHDHIAAFGGDPKRVTLFGESAGAASVNYHMMSAGSDGLFQSAIMESLTAAAPTVYFSKDKAQQNAQELADIVGCTSTRLGTISNTIDCLLSKSASELTKEQFNVDTASASFRPRFGPTVDGTFLVKSPYDVIANGEVQAKNTLLGINSDEGGYYVAYAFPNQFKRTDSDVNEPTATEYRQMIDELKLKPAQAAAVAFEYSTPCRFTDRQTSTYFSALSNIVGDTEFKCPLLNFAVAYTEQIQKSGDPASVYMYSFERRDPLDPWPQWAGRALHGDDTDYVFGLPLSPQFAASYMDADRALSSQMIEYWSNFAKSGDPNRNSDASSQTSNQWPKYTNDERLAIVLDTAAGLQTTAGLRDRQCEFWNVLIPSLGAATDDGSRLCGSQSLTTALFLLTAVFANLRHIF